jgi:catechol 2,3-dioxygenase-like lactoylglutathione lyase family enzyme
MAKMTTRLNLVVIRSPDIDRAVDFYRALGLLFTKHSHGTGPGHYSSEGGGLVFEIYPLADGQPPTTATRVGFIVNDLDVLVRMVIEAGATVVSAPRDSPWGRRAVVRDLDGHSVELVSQPPESDIRTTP